MVDTKYINTQMNVYEYVCEYMIMDHVTISL